MTTPPLLVNVSLNSSFSIFRRDGTLVSTVPGNTFFNLPAPNNFRDKELAHTVFDTRILFDRNSVPTAPSWNHDPVEGPKIAQRRFGEMVGPPSGYTSDLYKEWQLRKEMWQWMLGVNNRVPAGAFKDMLS